MDYDRVYKHGYNVVNKWPDKYQFEGLSRKIIGAAIKVHRELGPGFLEGIYEEALKIELSQHDISLEFQKEVKINYQGIDIGTHRLDLLVEKKIYSKLGT